HFIADLLRKRDSSSRRRRFILHPSSFILARKRHRAPRSSRFNRHYTSVFLLVAIALAVAALMLVVYAGNGKDFAVNTSMLTAGNYSPSGTPTNTDDVRITRTTATLTITSDTSLAMESLSVANGNTYTINNGASSSGSNSTVTVGNNSGFTNNF